MKQPKVNWCLLPPKSPVAACGARIRGLQRIALLPGDGGDGPVESRSPEPSGEHPPATTQKYKRSHALWHDSRQTSAA